MTRVDTRNPQQNLAIRINSKSTPNSCRYPWVVALATFVVVIYFAVQKPGESTDDSTEFDVRNVPRMYSKLEAVDPEERDVFQGFRTSFLPPEEIVLARKKAKGRKEFYEGNMTSDIFIWGSSGHQATPTRVKRMSHFSFSSQNSNEDEEDDEKLKDSEDEYSREDSEDSSKSEDYKSYDDEDDLQQGQPELEEGEMGSSPYVYKPGRSYSGIHAFWKGQGDRETIRTTQATIMKKYMDAQADPCHDFYQYACGNWASLNPIPADKAGYDTFEMLRENLDTVLKELLEFKCYESVPCAYPGKHLDLADNFLKNYKPPCYSDETTPQSTTEFNIDELLKNATSEEYLPNLNYSKWDKSEIIDRIRRYLDRKSRRIKNPIAGIKSRVQEHFLKTYKYQKTRVKRFKDMIVDEFQKTQMHFKRHFTMHSKQAKIGRKPLMYVDSEIKKRKERQLDDTEMAVTECAEKPKTINITYSLDDQDAQLKARYLFKSCMNYEILKKRGHQPLLDLLDLLGGWPILDPQWNGSNFDWLELMAKLRLYNNDILISEWVGPDIKNSDEFVIQFDQTSLGLPTRDYFLQEANKEYLEAYKNYLIKIAMLLGGKSDHVRESANELIEFEIKLAKITSAPEDRRNVSELYRRMPLCKLEELVPEVKWRRYLCVVMNRTVDSKETVVLFALSYVRHLVQLINDTEPSILSNYLLWRFVRHRVNNLDDRFQSAKQQFYFILFGREQAPPRWKNCISQVNSNMGMSLGSMFVKKYFDETSKNDTLTMTREIQQSFRELLHMTDWIDDNTKKLAAHKVDAMMLRIGYPDFILNKKELDDRYKEVKIHPDKYFENILNILQHLTKMEQSRLGQPVNKTLWNTAPAVVNAYYSRNKNQIMFPAGILQPPFYHRHFPRSLNYGGIGVVIGHEITHGFDDKGRLFDCDGNLHRWWSDSAIEAFHRRAQCLIDQYGQYIVPEVNMKLDGVNTQGENIADNGGVKQAFRAYLHWLQEHGDDGETLPGLNHTHTQLFFLNFAQVWCGAMRPEAMRNKLKTAVHSPGRFRVIGTLSNSHDFAREFRCPPGSPMNPKQKCTVW
ncbi:neprilysin-4-like isoform X2 [Pectinophora gossypiella]|uniref:neprilysin-4-like isoform X2 n=1 Tax=Pectinophora gossypiella TaxID=13191 RepID=UPI00214E3918|nr:neprilysin-4-like isoform X2 [Pectinophora gossypiella]